MGSSTQILSNHSNENLVIGIDWADKKHDYYLITSDGQQQRGVFDQTPEAIANWVQKLQTAHPQAALDICIEIQQGALISALLMHDNVRIFPINPLQLSRYRDSQDVSGRKGDPTDAQLIAQFLSNYRHKLRMLSTEDPNTRRLQILVKHRRQIVDARKDRGNELLSLLKQYFPLMVELSAAKIYADFICKMLLKWPTLEKLQRVKPDKLRKFFYACNLRGDHVNTKLQLIADAQPLTTDPVLLESLGMKVNHLVQLLLLDSKAVVSYDRQIKALLKEHADYEIVNSLPGAALQMQSRMIAALGTDRKRFESAQQLQCYSGIAPVTRRSGRSCYVHHRWACTKFVKQTFHEYAGLSITKSIWAKAYYDMLLSRGKKSQSAKRALAYKWQRIIFRCWQDGKPYDEARYIDRLRQAGSPIIKFMEAQAAVENTSAEAPRK